MASLNAADKKYAAQGNERETTRGLSEQVSNPVQTALHEADNGNQGSEGHQAGSMMHGSNKRKRGVACFTSLCWLVGLMWAVT
eukprot:scaffold135858_cov16-Tisochrysis_lutea.AAC.1